MIKFKFNYDFDTEGFFSGAEGETRKQTLEQAASFYGNFITDSLLPITSGSETINIGGNGGINTWTAKFTNPATGNQETISDLNIDADTIIIYAGGRDLTSLGRGGSGGWSARGKSDFLSLIRGRGQTGALTSPPSDIGVWGGTISFDTNIAIGSTTYDWHNATDLSGLDSGEFDFLSVAIHELAHVLGFGSSSWANQISGTNFMGTNALEIYQAETDPNATSVPLQSNSLAHWSDGTNSLTLAGESQQAALTRYTFNGQRELLTNLDYAGLQDIGWEFDFSSLNLLEPIRVEAEDYLNYQDTTAGNTGKAYRDDDVDLQATSDMGGGFNVGWIASGEWLTYDVDVPESGWYKIQARVASAGAQPHHLDLSLDGQSTSFNFDSTGGWQSWEYVSGGNLNLNAGSHELRLDLGTSNFNLNYIDLVPLESIRVEAEDYLNYYDTTAGNTGKAYRDDDVDLQATSDMGGGFNVGWITSGEWLTYDVDVPQSGWYEIQARVASAGAQPHHLDLSLDGQSTSFNFDGTGGWQSWEYVSGGNLNLNAGSHELRLDLGTSNFNLNYIDLVPISNSTISDVSSNELLANLEPEALDLF